MKPDPDALDEYLTYEPKVKLARSDEARERLYERGTARHRGLTGLYAAPGSKARPFETEFKERFGCSSDEAHAIRKEARHALDDPIPR